MEIDQQPKDCNEHESLISTLLVFRRGQFRLKVFASQGDIYIPNNNTDISSYDRAKFIHELVHVYQQKTLGWSTQRVGAENILAGNDYCYLPLESGKHYSAYNQEEQAEMVSDRFLLNKGFSQRLVCNRSVSLQQLDGVIDL
jgi:hypothetical protein